MGSRSSSRIAIPSLASAAPAFLSATDLSARNTAPRDDHPVTLVPTIDEISWTRCNPKVGRFTIEVDEQYVIT